MDLALREKYTSNHVAGMMKLETGDFPLWYGIPEADVPKPFVAAVIQVNARLQGILDRIAAAAEQNQVTIYLADKYPARPGRFPAHITLSQGKVDDLNFAQVSECTDELVGDGWTFEHFVLSGRDCIICSEDGPAQVADMRAEINQVMNGPNLALEASSPPILHATIFRIMSYPNLSALAAFVQEMLSIRAEIDGWYLDVGVQTVYWGPVGPFLSGEQTIPT